MAVQGVSAAYNFYLTTIELWRLKIQNAAAAANASQASATPTSTASAKAIAVAAPVPVSPAPASTPAVSRSDDDGDNDGNGNRDTLRSDYASLFSAVQSGDMTAAQSALATLQSDLGPLQATASYASPFQSKLAGDLQALETAVQSGDAGAASTALQSLLTDVSSRHHHHHHDHHEDSSQGSNAINPAASDPSVSSGALAVGAATPASTAAGN